MKYLYNFVKYNEGLNIQNEMNLYKDFVRTQWDGELKISDLFHRGIYTNNSGKAVLAIEIIDNVLKILIPQGAEDFIRGILKGEFLHNHPFLDLCKGSESRGYKVILLYKEIDFFREGICYSLLMAEIEGTKIYERLIPYFVKYSSKEDVIKWWNNVNNQLETIKLLKLLNDSEPNDLDKDKNVKWYYIAEVPYAKWVKDRYLFPDGFPIKIIHNRNNEETATSKGKENKYDCFILCSENYIKKAISITKQYPNIFTTLETPIESKMYSIKSFSEIYYGGCWDKFVSDIENPEVIKIASGLTDIGF